MQASQLLLFDGQGWLADELRQRSRVEGWWLRELRRPGACMQVLRRGGPGVLVLPIGRNLEREFTLMDQVARLSPDTAIVVVGEARHASLAGLAWDLGAVYVSIPPQPRDQLLGVVLALMDSIGREPLREGHHGAGTALP